MEEKCNAFNLRPGTRQGCPSLLFNTVLEVLASTVKTRNIKGTDWKGRSIQIKHFFVF